MQAGKPPKGGWGEGGGASDCHSRHKSKNEVISFEGSKVVVGGTID